VVCGPDDRATLPNSTGRMKCPVSACADRPDTRPSTGMYAASGTLVVQAKTSQIGWAAEG